MHQPALHKGSLHKTKHLPSANHLTKCNEHEPHNEKEKSTKQQQRKRRAQNNNNFKEADAFPAVYEIWVDLYIAYKLQSAII